MTTEPAPAAPDTKDWTWVLREPCPDCGYRSDTPHEAIPEVIRDAGIRWQQVLVRPEVGRRPESAVWSPLEYACHVRDVCRIFDERLALMLEQDDPQFENWDQDATAVRDRYWAADPAAVADQIGTASAQVADRFAGVGDDQWRRVGRRSNGSEFTVETLGWYFLHDVIHHLHDVDG